MHHASSTQTLERYAQISDLAGSVRHLISKGMIPLVVALSIEISLLWFRGHPGTTCFILVSGGSLLVLNVWRQSGIGLPVVPLIALQNLLAYALPIVVSNETVMAYPQELMTKAGFEILIFSGSLAVFWRFGMEAITESSPLCYALQGFEDEKLTKLSKLGFGLATGATIYVVLRSLGVLDFLLQMLPSGSASIITALLSGISACGFFLSSMMLGKGVMTAIQRILFWIMLGLNCYISASSFLLSSTTMIIFSVLIGLFWSTGRIPWKFMLVFISVISFLNLGKFEMRERYWRPGNDDQIPEITFTEMPRYYQEWAVASMSTITGGDELLAQAEKYSNTRKGALKPQGQSILDRVNNLQNLLFVMDAMQGGRITPLGGATYSLIPPLLVPRIIWPEKPRTHEGQILLNVHFGRQDMNSTLQTYIAWGLQAEAYGNFGALTGDFFLGMVLGLLFAWVEKFAARKLLLSMEGFLAFTLFVGMANSFEMVASVLITSLFQSFIPIVFACRPFVERVVPERRLA